MNKKKIRFTVAVALSLVFGLAITAAATATSAPGTILHVVTVQWKADSTPAQQQAALDGLRKMATEIPGIKTIWIKKLKVQPAEFSTVFAIEFESKAAFEVYTNHPAHKEWEKIYLPIREESRTEDVTN